MVRYHYARNWISPFQDDMTAFLPLDDKTCPLKRSNTILPIDDWQRCHTVMTSMGTPVSSGTGSPSAIKSSM